MAKHVLNPLRRPPVAPVLAALLAASSLSSCGSQSTTLRVMQGNHLFDQGEEALATLHYLEAGRELEGSLWSAWVSYDLGNVYLALGQLRPGIRLLRQALAAVPAGPSGPIPRSQQELAFRIAFNLGVAHYDLGEFTEAAAMFRQALRARPGSWDAKVNLELTLASLIRRPAARPKPQEDRQQSAATAQVEELLRAIHEEEEPAWRSYPAPQEYRSDW